MTSFPQSVATPLACQSAGTRVECPRDTLCDPERLQLMTLLDARVLEQLISEFRRSMRGLLKEVCQDFERNYADAACTFGLPIDWFRTLGQSFTSEDYSNGKVVGWIESLNDLLYFVDILVQVRQERSRGEIAAQLRAEFREKFYEHGYADEIFPNGKPESRLLLSRLTAFCQRLAREITQESVCLAPQLACAWVAGQGKDAWLVPCDLNANVERVELPWVCAVGTAGLSYVAPAPVRSALKRAGGQGEFRSSRPGSICWSAIKIMPWLHTARRRGGIGGVSSPCASGRANMARLYSGRHWSMERTRRRWRCGRRGRRLPHACDGHCLLLRRPGRRGIGCWRY